MSNGIHFLCALLMIIVRVDNHVKSEECPDVAITMDASGSDITKESWDKFKAVAKKIISKMTSKNGDFKIDVISFSADNIDVVKKSDYGRDKIGFYKQIDGLMFSRTQSIPYLSRALNYSLNMFKTKDCINSMNEDDDPTSKYLFIFNNGLKTNIGKRYLKELDKITTEGNIQLTLFGFSKVENDFKILEMIPTDFKIQNINFLTDFNTFEKKDIITNNVTIIESPNPRNLNTTSSKKIKSNTPSAMFTKSHNNNNTSYSVNKHKSKLHQNITKKVSTTNSSTKAVLTFPAKSDKQSKKITSKQPGNNESNSSSFKQQNETGTIDKLRNVTKHVTLNNMSQQTAGTTGNFVEPHKFIPLSKQVKMKEPLKLSASKLITKNDELPTNKTQNKPPLTSSKTEHLAAANTSSPLINTTLKMHISKLNASVHVNKTKKNGELDTTLKTNTSKLNATNGRVNKTTKKVGYGNMKKATVEKTLHDNKTRKANITKTSTTNVKNDNTKKNLTKENLTKEKGEATTNNTSASNLLNVPVSIKKQISNLKQHSTNLTNDTSILHSLKPISVSKEHQQLLAEYNNLKMGTNNNSNSNDKDKNNEEEDPVCCNSYEDGLFYRYYNPYPPPCCTRIQPPTCCAFYTTKNDEETLVTTPEPTTVSTSQTTTNSPATTNNPATTNGSATTIETTSKSIFETTQKIITSCCSEISNNIYSRYYYYFYPPSCCPTFPTISYTTPSTNRNIDYVL